MTGVSVREVLVIGKRWGANQGSYSDFKQLRVGDYTDYWLNTSCTGADFFSHFGAAQVTCNLVGRHVTLHKV